MSEPKYNWVAWKNEIDLPDGYEFRDENGNVIKAQKIVLEKKGKGYPKTYEECVKCIKSVKEASDRAALLCKMERLLACRDAYWKIAGDYKPEFGGEPYYTIHVANYEVDAKAGFNGLTNCTRNTILAFPTDEMRDAFYENFKDLIEDCKELL